MQEGHLNKDGFLLDFPVPFPVNFLTSKGRGVKEGGSGSWQGEKTSVVSHQASFPIAVGIRTN